VRDPGRENSQAGGLFLPFRFSTTNSARLTPASENISDDLINTEAEEPPADSVDDENPFEPLSKNRPTMPVPDFHLQDGGPWEPIGRGFEVEKRHWELLITVG